MARVARESAVKNFQTAIAGINIEVRDWCLEVVSTAVVLAKERRVVYAKCDHVSDVLFDDRSGTAELLVNFVGARYRC